VQPDDSGHCQSGGPRRVAEFLMAGPNDEIQADVVGFVRELLKNLEG